ncbi:MAG: DUF192 domain-containing protein [Pseudomonadota bacterium]
MAFWVQAALAEQVCLAEDARQVRIGPMQWQVEVAHTLAARTRGLSGRTALPPGTAMWFVFPGPETPGFWMKDMAFPIDLAWVNAQGRVVGVERMAPCEPWSCPIHYPPEPVAYVLETAAGEIPEDAERAHWFCVP